MTNCIGTLRNVGGSVNDPAVAWCSTHNAPYGSETCVAKEARDQAIKDCIEAVREFVDEEDAQRRNVMQGDSDHHKQLAHAFGLTSAAGKHIITRLKSLLGDARSHISAKDQG